MTNYSTESCIAGDRRWSFLPDRHWLIDKLTTLFEPRHARWDGQIISFETGRFMDGSIATSKFLFHDKFASN